VPTRYVEPWGGVWRHLLPEGCLVAVPSGGITLHRLVVNERPEPEDFQPSRQRQAEKQGLSELDRTGLSHFLTAEAAKEIIWKPSQRVARLVYPAHSRIHIARTDRDLPGHFNVWIPVDLLEAVVETAEIVEDHL
jgi:hypothetical protein